MGFFEIVLVAAAVVFGYKRVIRYMSNRAEAERRKLIASSLTGIRAAVYVRQPNGSRTALERHLEQELIARGADVVLANQEAGASIIKHGIFVPLASGALWSLVGTLVTGDGVDVVPAESYHDFDVRKAKWAALHKDWKKYGEDFGQPEPILKPREEGGTKNVCTFQFSFQLIDHHGSIPYSGNLYRVADPGKASYDDVLRIIAEAAFRGLDDTNIWQRDSIMNLLEPGN